MRSILLRVGISAADLGAAFSAIAAFDGFPALAEDVRTVIFHPANDPARPRVADWVMNFRRGLMRWTERESLDPAALRIDFALTDGDFEEFSGSWQLVPTPGGADVRFAVTYDFGIESLVGIMDPIAERVIKRAVCAVLTGLFGEISIIEGGEALTDLGDLSSLPGLTTSIGGS